MSDKSGDIKTEFQVAKAENLKHGAGPPLQGAESLSPRGRREREDEVAGWHHQCDGHEPGQTPGDGEGQGSLACCSPWAHKE